MPNQKEKQKHTNRTHSKSPNHQKGQTIQKDSRAGKTSKQSHYLVVAPVEKLLANGVQLDIKISI